MSSDTTAPPVPARPRSAKATKPRAPLANSPRLPGRPAVGTKRGKLIAIASGKGGGGKTFFSITLSQALTLRKQKTLLFDGDLGLANVDIQLGLMPQHDLGSVITGKLSLNQAAMKYNTGGFDVIAGRSGSGSLANIPLSRLQIIAEDLESLNKKAIESSNTDGKRTILVIDDDPTIRDLMTRHLEKNNLAVLQALDGAQGIKMAREYKPNAITLDILL